MDVVTLGSTFGSLAALMTATSEQLAACPGIGPTKVRRLHDTFHAPFRRTGPRQLRLQPAAAGAERGGDAQAGSEAAPPSLVPPPLALQPLEPDEPGATGGGAEEEEEQGPYDEAEEDGAGDEEPPGEFAAGGPGDPTDEAFYASLAPEVSDDD